MPNVSSLPANPELSQYSPYGRNYGNGLLNLLAFSAFGFNYAPKPEGAQGMYDAYYNRERSRQFMNIQQDAFANNILFKMGGFNPENNMLQFAGRAFGSPDSMVSRMLSPLIGGNPMAAQMQLYAGLSGGSVMGAFGRLGDISKSETDDMMRVIEKNFYKTTPIDQVEKEMSANFRRELIKNPEYARQLGIGVPTSPDGTVNKEQVEFYKQQGADREKNITELAKLQQDFQINEEQIKRPFDSRITENASNKLESLFDELTGLSSADNASEDPIGFIRGAQTNLRDASTNGINLEIARKSLEGVSERLKTPQKYSEEVADRMAERMGIRFKKKFNEREIVSEGGVPVEIDGQAVPAELHTQEQRDRINAARQAVAANNDEPIPSVYGEGIQPASEELYSDIVKPETDPEARKRLISRINEGYRLTNLIEENERNRPYSPERAASMATELENTVVASGLADEQTINQNKVGGRLTAEFVKSLEASGKATTQKIELLNKNLKENESKVGSPDYNEEVSKQISNEIKDNLKREFNLTDEELATATNNKGLVAPEFVQTQIQKREEAVRRTVGLFEQLGNFKENKPVTKEEIQTVSRQIEQQIQETNVLTDRQIRLGKDSDGNVTESLVKSLDKINNRALTDIGSLNVDLNNNELKSATQEYDKELSKAISEQIKKKLTKAFKVTEEELEAATNTEGVIDPRFVKTKLDEQQAKVQSIRENITKLTELQKEQTAMSPENIKKNDKRQAEIRRILKDTYGFTDERILQSTDERGNIKKEVIADLEKTELERAEVEKTGISYDQVNAFDLTKNAQKVRGNYLTRTMKADKLGKLQQQIKEARNEDTEAGRERADKLQEELNQQLKRINVTDKELSDNTVSEGGFLGIGTTKSVSDAFIAKKQEELTRITYADTEAQRLLQYRKAGGKISGINFERTRGFNMEDFTSGFTAAADLRLAGGPQDKSTPVERMDQFMQNAGGAMSAAKSVFGDEFSGGQLITKISDLMGSKAKNLTTKQGAEEIEKTLRDVKATARVAGISIDALLGIIDQAKEVARNNPRLRNMSSAATLDMSLKALSTTTAMAGVMNSEEYRRAGGVQEMLGKKLGEEQKLLGSDVGQSLMGLQQMFAGDPEKMKAFKRALKEGRFEENGITELEMPRLLQEIVKQPEMQGTDISDLIFGMNDPTLREFGTQNNEIVGTTRELMNKAGSAQFFRRLGSKEEGYVGLSKQDFIKGYTEAKKAAEEKGESLTLRDYVSKVVGGKDPVAMNLFGQLEQTISEEIQRTVDPEYFKKVDETRKRQAELDTQLDKKLGGRNAPIVTQIMNELAQGNKLDDSKTSRIMQLFADQNVYSDQGEIDRLQTGFKQALDASAVQDSEGVAEGLSKALGLEEDLSAEDIENITTAGTTEADYTAAQNDYRALISKEENAGFFSGERLDEFEESRLKAYRKMEELGLIDKTNTADKQKAFEALAANPTASGVTAGVMIGENDKKNKAQIAEVKTEVAKGLSSLLEDRAKETSKLGKKDQDVTKQLLEYYKGKGGTERMMQDAESGSGAFDESSDIGKTLASQSEDTVNQIRDTINKANEQIDATEKKVAGEGSEASPEADLSKQLKNLIDALDKSRLTQAIEDLAGNIR